MRRIACLFVSVVIVAAASVTPSRSSASVVPKQEDICVGGKVDKKALSEFLLDAYAVRTSFREAAPPDPSGRFAAMPTWQRLFSDEQLQPPCSICSTSFVLRFQKDLDGLAAATQAMASILRDDHEAYVNPSDTLEPAKFLADPTAQLICQKDSSGKPIEAPGAVQPKLTYSLPLRIRGSVDGLYYPREADQFKALDPAALSIGYNGAKNTRTDKVVAVVAYPIEFSLPTPGFFQVIPYAGVNRNISKASGKKSTITSKTEDYGFLNAYYTTTALPSEDKRSALILGNWISGRVDYLANHQDSSGLVTINLRYAPVINGWVNDYRRLIPGRDNLISFSPILDARFDQGVYTDKGDSKTTKDSTYSRLGGQVGVAVTSDHPWVPVDIVVTDTYLEGLSGDIDALNYFKAGVSISFDPKKYFGLSLTYGRGRREDTGVRERNSSLALSLKY